MIKGDWVFHKGFNYVGRVVDDSVLSKHNVALINWENSHDGVYSSWANRKYLTPITKEVADIIRSVKDDGSN